MRKRIVLICLVAPPLWAQPGQQFIDNWDLDGDGAVTLTEAQERRGDVFASFDADEDGFLSAGEYVVFDEARANDMAANGPGPGQAAMQRAADGLRLQANDTDGDGRVSLAEFIGATPGWIAAMDRDGNGLITSRDFDGGS
ncbi:EF-hand domain-containing protein [Actibacterium ureilyticum]|uniref:EF-hand domain-containing protein n=1 Tax=Actibacterium ureilyticum TaxID=1590614 RepID=UPI001141048F|nr:EF-hand domain-containing protein [Actibacterium ureilyticum]